jgi:DNA-binding ferritin-like protein
VYILVKFNIKIDTKKLQNSISQIIEDNQKELEIKARRKNGNMISLSCNAETMLDIFLDKYNKKKDYEINGKYEEFPKYIKFSIKETMQELKYAGIISKYENFVSDDWYVILTPDALKYYSRKGSRNELFNELSSSDKKLLEELIEAEKNKEDISELLKEKVDNDTNDIIRGIIENLKSNGLINVMFADDTICYASLTQQGRTFFERENEFKKNKISSEPKVINIENFSATNSNVFMADVINSSVVLNNTISEIESEINSRCKDENEKEELKSLLNETKEIVNDYKESKQFSTRKEFFRKLSENLDKHGWFYGAIANLLGQAALMKISGQI